MAARATTVATTNCHHRLHRPRRPPYRPRLPHHRNCRQVRHLHSRLPILAASICARTAALCGTPTATATTAGWGPRATTAHASTAWTAPTAVHASSAALQLSLPAHLHHCLPCCLEASLPRPAQTLVPANGMECVMTAARVRSTPTASRGRIAATAASGIVGSNTTHPLRPLNHLHPLHHPFHHHRRGGTGSHHHFDHDLHLRLPDLLRHHQPRRRRRHTGTGHHLHHFHRLRHHTLCHLHRTRHDHRSILMAEVCFAQTRATRSSQSPPGLPTARQLLTPQVAAA